MIFFGKEIEKDRESIKTGNNKDKVKKFNFLDKINTKDIQKLHEETELMRKTKSKAILNALKLNPIEIYGREIHNEDRLLNKFKYVLKRAKKNMCLGNDEIKHRDRITILKRK